MTSRVLSFFYCILGLTLVINADCQISPPGLDGAKLVTWGAVGLNQKLSKRLSATVYIGGSEQSDPTNYSTLKKGAIFVINEETLFQFDEHWQASLGLSFRIQDIYEENSPYTSEDPPYRKEVRYYSRLYYKHTVGKATWTYAIRPEYRVFYTPEGEDWPSPIQVRLRLKGSVNIPVNASKSNQIILANEWLTATNQGPSGKWSALEFTEDRLSTYFRHVFKKPVVFLDLGLMHQLWKDREGEFQYTTYLAFDILFQNPFSK